MHIRSESPSSANRLHIFCENSPWLLEECPCSNLLWFPGRSSWAGAAYMAFDARLPHLRTLIIRSLRTVTGPHHALPSRNHIAAEFLVHKSQVVLGAILRGTILPPTLSPLRHSPFDLRPHLGAPVANHCQIGLSCHSWQAMRLVHPLQHQHWIFDHDRPTHHLLRSLCVTYSFHIWIKRRPDSTVLAIWQRIDLEHHFIGEDDLLFETDRLRKSTQITTISELVTSPC